MNTLSHDWIEQVAGWRTRMEVAPKPFLTPDLFNSAVYLFGETAELLGAIQKHHNPQDLRNPQSARGEIKDELGDCLLMLATVCKHVNKDPQIVSWPNLDKAFLEVGPGWYHLPSRLTRYAHNLVEHIEVNDHLTFTHIRIIYLILMEIANTYSIRMSSALAATMKKLEERAGLHGTTT